MNRRSFLKGTTAGMAGGLFLSQPSHLQTRHVILVVNSGARKKDYYENPSAPNIGQLAAEGFVFEEDHCDSVTFHRASLGEMIQGLPGCVFTNDGSRISEIIAQSRPRILVYRDSRHDAGHDAGGYEEYLAAVKENDESVGRIAKWVKNDPYFGRNTAIVVRPEFGRDDVMNVFGELHHSPGFYYTHRVASIFWGPDFNKGVDRRTVINRRDMAPTLAKLLSVDLENPAGRVVPGLFKASVVT
jgi:hypothetical protein